MYIHIYKYACVYLSKYTYVYIYIYIYIYMETFIDSTHTKL